MNRSKFSDQSDQGKAIGKLNIPTVLGYGVKTCERIVCHKPERDSDEQRP
jgi:hypothetical protein